MVERRVARDEQPAGRTGQLKLLRDTALRSHHLAGGAESGGSGGGGSMGGGSMGGSGTGSPSDGSAAEMMPICGTAQRGKEA